VYSDAATFSSCNSPTGPFPGFPVALEGDDVSALIEEHRDDLPFSDQILTFDPPVHTAHRGLLMRLITPKRLRENEEVMWRGDGDVPGRLRSRRNRRRAHRREPLRGGSGDERPSLRHGVATHRRRPRAPAAAARPTRHDPELRGGVPSLREPGEGRLPARARH